MDITHTAAPSNSKCAVINVHALILFFTFFLTTVAVLLISNIFLCYCCYCRCYNIKEAKPNNANQIIPADMHIRCRKRMAVEGLIDRHNPRRACLASPTLFKPACGLWLELESGVAGRALIR